MGPLITTCPLSFQVTGSGNRGNLLHQNDDILVHFFTQHNDYETAFEYVTKVRKDEELSKSANHPLYLHSSDPKHKKRYLP